MKIFINNILLAISLLGVLSCTPSAPYEIRSPCVSIDNPYVINPCGRRPVNMNYAFA